MLSNPNHFGRRIHSISMDEFNLKRNEFDCIIDVRSPSEFKLDHIESSINLPVLNDQQRIEVGTLHKNEGAFNARKIGAAFISANIAVNLNSISKNTKEWKPLVYCWRGGQRSKSMAIIMAEIGWRVCILSGGYKSYRKWVTNTLDNLIHERTFITVAGSTGNGKTEIIINLRKNNFQIIDFENLAMHRGSLLGSDPINKQPPQKLFETRLLNDLRKTSPVAPIWIESESSKIGDCHLPRLMMKKMRESETVSIKSNIEKRAKYLVDKYKHLTEKKEHLTKLLNNFNFRQSKKQIDHWKNFIEKESWTELAISLLSNHYDPAYEESQKKLSVTHELEIETPGKLNNANINKLIFINDSVAQKLTCINQQ